MFGWLGGKALLYVLIVLAILAATILVPWIKAEWTGPSAHLERAERLEAVRAEVEAAQDEATRRLSATGEAARTAGIVEINRALATARQARAAAIAQRRSGFAQTASIVRVDTDAIIADRQREVEIAIREREIAGLRAARDRLEQGASLASLNAGLQRRLTQARQLEPESARARASCRLASDRLEEFEERWLVRGTLGLYRRGRLLELRQEQRSRCAEANRLTTLFQTERAAVARLNRQRIEAERVYRQSRGWAEGTIGSVTGEIDRRIAAERTAANGSLRAKAGLWAERVQLASVLKTAAIVLLVIVLTPYLVRLFCYYVLAPAAMRRAAIRIAVPGGGGVAIPLSERSTTSVAVRLSAGEELLVRQDYLQSTSHAGAKDTQFFLHRRYPLTSLATGLTFLTRIRGDGEVTTISAVRDPFAEVTILTLPEGGSCVLQPRALAAVVQPTDQPLRVSSHWRLFSLNAWLTLQLRYFVFHGPARLVIKGGRGVRVERAERGRVFGQHQLVGFSADLAYSVTRNETFCPYFLGREQLLKDQVEEGAGVLIVEEAPLAGRGNGEVKTGLEGMVDAGMKVFGM